MLAVDPSSTRTGGSILGDKTRMERLAVDPAAFVRPSPSAGTLGGVARATRESMVVMEAAGYDVVLVETVGVGQSETAVANMVDSFLLLTLARTGDQLQGIKKGVLELADVVAVNKADGPHARDARSAARELAGALRLMQPADARLDPPVLTCSAREGTGLDVVWERLEQHRRVLEATGRAGGQAARPAGRLDLVDGARPAARAAARPPRGPAARARAGTAGPRGHSDADPGRRGHHGGVRPEVNARRGLPKRRGEVPRRGAGNRSPASCRGRPTSHS